MFKIQLTNSLKFVNVVHTTKSSNFFLKKEKIGSPSQSRTDDSTKKKKVNNLVSYANT